MLGERSLFLAMVLVEQSPSWQDGTAEGRNGVATGRDAGQQEQEAGWLMGTVCPGFRPVYSVCPMGPQMRPNPTGTNLTRQGPADVRTAQNTAGTAQPASLSSLVILMILWLLLVPLCQSCLGQM